MKGRREEREEERERERGREDLKKSWLVFIQNNINMPVQRTIEPEKVNQKDAD